MEKTQQNRQYSFPISGEKKKNLPQEMEVTDSGSHSSKCSNKQTFPEEVL